MPLFKSSDPTKYAAGVDCGFVSEIKVKTSITIELLIVPECLTAS
jgi:hypothetical protein